jgi:hypothetical protein
MAPVPQDAPTFRKKTRHVVEVFNHMVANADIYGLVRDRPGTTSNELERIEIGVDASARVNIDTDDSCALAFENSEVSPECDGVLRIFPSSTPNIEHGEFLAKERIDSRKKCNGPIDPAETAKLRLGVESV